MYAAYCMCVYIHPCANYDFFLSKRIVKDFWHCHCLGIKYSYSMFTRRWNMTCWLFVSYLSQINYRGFSLLYWCEYSPTLYSCEVFCEMRAGALHGCGVWHKNSQAQFSSQYLLESICFCVCYVCSWHKVYYSLAIIISLHLKIHLKYM